MALIFSSNLVFSNNTFALFTPTLSASVDQVNLQVNGNQVINSVSQTSELPIQVTVNTNNRTGYTATLSTETNETALVNTASTSGAKIESIDANKTLMNFSGNTWGIFSPSSGNYQPIPSFSNSANLFSTTTKTSGNEGFSFKVGMKLSENLESGNYTNKLVVSIVSNPYERRAVMTTGKDFNRKIDSIITSLSNDDGWGNKESVSHILRSTVPISNVPSSAINVEHDEYSDYPIKVWYDTASKTVFYWTEADKIFLNKDSKYLFRGFTKVEDIDIINFDSSEVEDMAYFFYKMNNLQSLDLSKFSTEKVADMTGMFAYAENLKKLNLSNFDTSKVTSMSAMFHTMTKLNELNIASFNTKNVTNMSGMFYDMSGMTALNLSNFDTSKVTSMTEMFSGASSLTSLNVSNFNTSDVTNMASMFAKTSKLMNLNLASFNTEKVRNMSGMFYGSDNLISLDLSNFNTKNVTNMSYMFFGMDGITTINAVNFDTQNVEDMSYLFGTETGSIDHLTTIYVNNNFNTDKLLHDDNIFMNRYQLRGGAGSFLSNPSTADKSWLRIDDPTHGRPGYFTRKP